MGKWITIKIAGTHTVHYDVLCQQTTYEAHLKTLRRATTTSRLWIHRPQQSEVVPTASDDHFRQAVGWVLACSVSQQDTRGRFKTRYQRLGERARDKANTVRVELARPEEAQHVGVHERAVEAHRRQYFLLPLLCESTQKKYFHIRHSKLQCLH